MTSNRPVSEMVERVRDVFASYDLDDFNRWSDRGVERFTREIIKAASSQAASDDVVERVRYEVARAERVESQSVMLRVDDVNSILAAIPSAVASDDVVPLQEQGFRCRPIGKSFAISPTRRMDCARPGQRVVHVPSGSTGKVLSVRGDLVYWRPDSRIKPGGIWIDISKLRIEI